jgi:CubicO group peptidase (beta-lactamase class C family)
VILCDFGAGPLQGGKTLSLDTKVCNSEWLRESLPLPDPRKAEITVRNLLNMLWGIGPEPVPMERPFEWSLGLVEGSPFAKLNGSPGTVFNYSNAGVAHLVLLFQHAQGEDLYPFLKRRLFDPIGMKQVRWEQIGGKGAIGPFSQGYSGIYTTPREHVRFCYLALHKGEWAGKRIVPSSYYDFAWAGTNVAPTYGGQWWRTPDMPGAPSDLAITRGRDHNSGFVIPSLDPVFVRLGNGSKFAKDFERELITKVVAAVEN